MAENIRASAGELTRKSISVVCFIRARRRQLTVVFGVFYFGKSFDERAHRHNAHELRQPQPISMFYVLGDVTDDGIHDD